MKSRKTLGFTGIALALVLAVAASACKSSQVTPVAVDAGQIGICVAQAVLDQVASGQTDSASIAIAVTQKCGATTAVEVEAILKVLTTGASPKMKAKLGAVKCSSKSKR